MKTKTSKVLIILLMMVSLSSSAQEEIKGLEIGIKGFTNLIKERGDCTFCVRNGYSFAKSSEKIKSQIEKLPSMKAKKQSKLIKRLEKQLATFADYSAAEWKGFSLSKSSDADQQLVRLKLRIEELLSIDPPDMKATQRMETSIARIAETHKQISEFLKH